MTIHFGKIKTKHLNKEIQVDCVPLDGYIELTAKYLPEGKERPSRSNIRLTRNEATQLIAEMQAALNCSMLKD